jgi:hypothetical protein
MDELPRPPRTPSLLSPLAGLVTPHLANPARALTLELDAVGREDLRAVLEAAQRGLEEIADQARTRLDNNGGHRAPVDVVIIERRRAAGK